MNFSGHVFTTRFVLGILMKAGFLQILQLIIYIQYYTTDLYIYMYVICMFKLVYITLYHVYFASMFVRIRYMMICIYVYIYIYWCYDWALVGRLPRRCGNHASAFGAGDKRP